jgi:hypothetical protein
MFMFPKSFVICSIFVGVVPGGVAWPTAATLDEDRLLFDTFGGKNLVKRTFSGFKSVCMISLSRCK